MAIDREQRIKEKEKTLKSKKNRKLENELDQLVNQHLNNRILQSFDKLHKELSEEVETAAYEIFKAKVKNPSLSLSQLTHYKFMDKKISQIMLKFLDNQMDLFNELYTDVYIQGMVDTDLELKKVGVQPTAEFYRPNIDHINQVLVETNVYFLRASKGIADNVRRTINDLVNDQLIKKLALGQDLKRATKDLVKKMEDKDIRFVTTSKRRYQLHTYAEMVLRTESRYMHTQAVRQRTIDNGWLYVKISSHSDPSDKCKPHQGKVFFIGKDKKDNFLNKEHLEDVSGVNALFHPNCRHVAMPYPIKASNTERIEKIKEQDKANQVKQEQTKQEQPKEQTKPIQVLPADNKAKGTPIPKPQKAVPVAPKNVADNSIKEFSDLARTGSITRLQNHIDNSIKRGVPKEQLASDIALMSAINSGKYEGKVFSVHRDAITGNHEILEFTQYKNVFLAFQKELDEFTKNKIMKVIDEVAEDPVYKGVKIKLEKFDRDRGYGGYYNCESDSLVITEVGNIKSTLNHEIGHRIHNVKAVEGSNDYTKMLNDKQVTITDEQWNKWDGIVSKFWKNGFYKNEKGKDIPDDMMNRWEYPMNAHLYYGRYDKTDFLCEMFAETTSVYLDNDPKEIEKVRRTFPGLLEFMEEVHKRGSIN